MNCFDVCNGDADGLFALRQWRLAHPEESIVVTGIKRDIGLLARVEAAAGDCVAVFDIALERNRAALERLLAAGASVTWFDHHAPGSIPRHDGLFAHIDTDPETCTSLLVDRHLKGRFRLWAIAAAYGDRHDVAEMGTSDLVRYLGLVLFAGGFVKAFELVEVRDIEGLPHQRQTFGSMEYNIGYAALDELQAENFP